MSNKVLKSIQKLVALEDFKAGQTVGFNGTPITLFDDVPAKHKF